MLSLDMRGHGSLPFGTDSTSVRQKHPLGDLSTLIVAARICK